MKFEYDEKASLIVNAMLNTLEPGKRMLVYKAYAGAWQFCMNYDEMHDQWATTYQERELVPGRKYTAIPCEAPLAITNKKYRYYKTREEAEASCQRKFIELQS